MPFIKGHPCFYRRKRPPILDICLVCGKTVNRKGAKYCSKKCYGIDSIPPTNKICQTCNKPFHRAPSRIVRGGDKYCSFTCSGLGRKTQQKINCRYCGKEFS